MIRQDVLVRRWKSVEGALASSEIEDSRLMISYASSMTNTSLIISTSVLYIYIRFLANPTP